jgi:hypothetical protein
VTTFLSKWLLGRAFELLTEEVYGRLAEAYGSCGYGRLRKVATLPPSASKP